MWLARVLEDRIETSLASSTRISKLYDRLEELKEEESQILRLFEKVPNSEPFATKDIIYTAEEEEEYDEKDKTEVPAIPSVFENQEVRDAFESTVRFSIADDYSNFDFSSRLDDWLSAEKFSAWRQNRDFFLNLDLGQQVSYELACFDVVSLRDGMYRVPRCLWDELFDYQQEGVEWLLELHHQGHGGVLGDEMGLGKTVEIAAFLAALHISGGLSSSSLVVAPSTLLKQWIRELNTWWPPLRVLLLHSSSSAFNGASSVKSLVSKNAPKTHVFVTSYGTASSSALQKSLLSQNWSTVILDEGHKIRNPDALITVFCKQLPAKQRLILSGTPIQNNLTELWSLFDFAYPGLLGSLPLFKAEFALPINAGGYSNASLIQVQTSYKCACTLKDLIKPFFLRRLKRNVLMNRSDGSLPEKREEIVFCRITPFQQQLYENFISSSDVQAIMERKKNVLAGIDILRKICNHPDLLELYCSSDRLNQVYQDNEDDDCTEEYPPFNVDLIKSIHNSSSASRRPSSHVDRSGKMAVLEKILDLWHRQGHKALIFCQTRQMLNILEEFLTTQASRYSFLRMDGMTAIKKRLQLVDMFNSPDSPYFVFLLTTRVGGLGINLTGADRVLIFDPDWNPSTDLQARERVYRLGQTRPVSILRLITAGTIEEKIYHRQIFKQYLTQRILEDPRQTRFFRAADLYDLFSLSLPEESDSTETGDMFAGLEEEFRKKVSSLNSRETSGTEDVLLDGLLDMVGVVHSTLSTTSITETTRSEYALIQKEAESIAQNALEALKRENLAASRSKTPSVVDHYNTFKPTNWKGKFGTRTGFGPRESSSLDAPEITAQDILEAIDQRRQKNQIMRASTADNGRPLQLALDIVDCLNRCGGVVESDRIAHAFRAQIQDSESAVLFRTLLRKVARFNKSTRKWYIFDEFIKT